MKRILVPMDYSEVGVNALKYALAAFPESQITILHVKTSSGDVSSNKGREVHQSLENFWAEKFSNLVFSSDQFIEKPTNVIVKALFGPIVTVVSNYVKKHNVDCVVMGTRDKYDLFDKWVGTVSLGVIKSINVPTYSDQNDFQIQNFLWR